jgi:hypothetical protein
MKNKYLIITAIIISLTITASAQDTTRVLFIGNSHTYTNDLPQLFADLCQSGGRPVIVGSSTPGGYTLEQHTTNATTLEKIAEGTWDYVVLQENSQYPVIEYLRYNSMYPASRYLDSLITYHGETTAFFLSWGWRYGGHFEIDGHESPVFEDYFEMQDTMTSAYTEIAAELEAILAPVGIAWKTAVTWDPELVLWDATNYHPALNGSYLAACVFYATFFNESPIGLTYTAGLDSAEALFLQEAAASTMTGIDDQVQAIPESFTLYQNYPNPFNASTTVAYDLKHDAQVSITIYDLLGREVITLIDSYQQTGRHSIVWKGINKQGQAVGSGLYFYNLKVDDYSQSKRMLLLK